MIVMENFPLLFQGFLGLLVPVPAMVAVFIPGFVDGVV